MISLEVEAPGPFRIQALLKVIFGGPPVVGTENDLSARFVPHSDDELPHPCRLANAPRGGERNDDEPAEASIAGALPTALGRGAGDPGGSARGQSEACWSTPRTAAVGSAPSTTASMARK